MTRFDRARRTAARAAVRVTVAVAVLAATSYASLAGNSPQGDTAAAWPPGWNSYNLADGNAVLDVLGDENPDDADLASGACAPTGCTGSSPTVYYASDGTTAFFRVRLAVDPSDATKGGLGGNTYLTQIAVGGVVKAVVGVDGKSASVDYVYTATAPGTTVTSIYEWPFTSPSASMRVVPAGGGQYFLDYQVPVARITAASGGAITAATPIQLYYGSSAAANLATINKDFMLGTATAVSFTNLAVVSLTPGTLSATSAAVATAGPNPPVAGSPTTYDVTLTMTNAGGGALSSAIATATLPAGVAYVSGDVSMSGSTLTWNAGTLLPGETGSVVVTVTLTPAAAGATPLLSALSATGEDAATGTKNASAPALSVTATADNAPTAVDDALTVAEDGSNTVDVLANDTDEGGPLTVTPSDPAHGSVTETGGVVTYTPDPGYHGSDSFTYEVCDNGGACDTATVTVTVTAVNDAPTAPPATSFTTPEDTAKSGTLPGSLDPDGDALEFGGTDEPAHGDVTIAADGSYTYTPDPDYAGADSFGYEVCDPSGACAPAVVTVTVTPVNDPPAAPPGTSFTTPDNTERSGTLPGSADPDGDPLEFHPTDPPQHGTVIVDLDGSYTYTPDEDYVGGDTFTYEVCDPSGACASAVVTVTVLLVNVAPVAADDAVGAAFGAEVSFDPTGNDTDGDGDALTITVTDPAHGSVLVTDNEVTYAPAPGWSGDDAFTYEVCDPFGACDTATVTVTTAAGAAVNSPPIANAGPDAATNAGSQLILDGSASTDPDDDLLSFSWAQVSGPPVTLTGAGTVLPSFVAPSPPAMLEFELTVSDGEASDTDVVRVTILHDDPLVPPRCDGDAVTSGDDGVTVELPCTLIHEDTTFVIVDGPENGTAEVLDSGEIRYVPDPGFSGTDRITVRICSAGGCIERVLTVTVHDNAVARPVVRPRGTGGLPATGSPADVLVAAAFLLVAIGLGMQRRGRAVT